MAIAFVQKASFELTKMQMQFSSDSFGEKKTSAKIHNCSPSSGVSGQILTFLLVLQNGVLPSNYWSGPGSGAEGLSLFTQPFVAWILGSTLLGGLAVRSNLILSKE